MLAFFIIKTFSFVKRGILTKGQWRRGSGGVKITDGGEVFAVEFEVVIRHNFFYFVGIEFVVCVHNLTVVRHGASVVYDHSAVRRKAEGVADALVVTFEENRGGDDDAVLKNAAPDFAVVAIFDVGIELFDRIFVIHNLSPFLL